MTPYSPATVQVHRRRLSRASVDGGNCWHHVRQRTRLVHCAVHDQQGATMIAFCRKLALALVGLIVAAVPGSVLVGTQSAQAQPALTNDEIAFVTAMAQGLLPDVPPI